MSSTRRIINLKDKVEIINMHNSNTFTEQEIRHKFEIDRVQMYRIISRKEEYLSQYSRAPIKNSVNSEVNNRVWEWFVESKANNIAVNGPMVQNQARKIAKQLGFDGFRASNGWLQCFKMRHNIRFSGPPTVIKGESQGGIMKEPHEFQTPRWPNVIPIKLETINPDLQNLSNFNEATCETIEIESDDEGSMMGRDMDENEIQDEICFEDEEISQEKYNPPLRSDVNVRDDMCRNYQDALDCIHRLQCFSVSMGDSKLLEMSTEMRNYVERTIYGE